MPRGRLQDILRALSLIHEAVAEERVRFTAKARAEMLVLCIDANDALEILAGLEASDYHQTLVSHLTGELLWVFKPLLLDEVLYVKVALREHCVVISLHEDEDGDDEE